VGRRIRASSPIEKPERCDTMVASEEGCTRTAFQRAIRQEVTP
jgi:hypothetical protein